MSRVTSTSRRLFPVVLGGLLVAVALASASAGSQGDGCQYEFGFWSPIRVVPTAAGRVVAGPGCVLRSADGGRTWRAGPSTPVRYLLPIGTHRALLGIAGSQLERSSDGGATWTVVLNGLSTPEPTFGVVGRQFQMAPTPLVADPNNPHSAWLCNQGGIFRTTDDGSTWSRIPGSPRCWALAAQPRGPTLIVTQRYGVIIRSTDGGAHWAAVKLPSFGWVTFSTAHPSVVVGISRGSRHRKAALQFWRSTDAGQHWVRTTAISLRNASPLPVASGAGAAYGGGRFVAGIFVLSRFGNDRFGYLTSTNGTDWRPSIVLHSNSTTQMPIPWVGVDLGGTLIAPAGGSQHGLANIFALKEGAGSWTEIGTAPDCAGVRNCEGPYQ